MIHNDSLKLVDHKVGIKQKNHWFWSRNDFLLVARSGQVSTP